MLSVCELGIAGVLEIRPQRFSDERGFFSETWNEDEWRKAGISLRFVQDNHSLSRSPGVLRGFHFQRPLPRRTNWCGLRVDPYSTS